MKNLWVISAITLLLVLACENNTVSATDSSSSLDISSSFISSESFSSSAISSQMELSSSSDKMSSDVPLSSSSHNSIPRIDSVVNYGFDLQIPKPYDVECPDAMNQGIETLNFSSVDLVCTLPTENTLIYVHAVPDGSCQRFMNPLIGYSAEVVLSKNGQLQMVDSASYSAGGNHQNNTFEFSYNGRTYEYNHSSYGWGFRKCHEVDCMITYDEKGGLVDDGCAMDRTTPIVCASVNELGKVDNVVDDFRPCAGDPNYED